MPQLKVGKMRVEGLPLSRVHIRHGICLDLGYAATMWLVAWFLAAPSIKLVLIAFSCIAVLGYIAERHAFGWHNPDRRLAMKAYRHLAVQAHLTGVVAGIVVFAVVSLATGHRIHQPPMLFTWSWGCGFLGHAISAARALRAPRAVADPVR